MTLDEIMLRTNGLTNKWTKGSFQKTRPKVYRCDIAHLTELNCMKIENFVFLK